LKTANILFREGDKSVHIADFGLSVDVSNMNEHTDLDNDVITFSFRPPEVILGDKNYNKTVDVWSLGCVFYALYTSQQFIATSSLPDGREPRAENLLMDIMRRIGKPSIFDCLYKLPYYYRYKYILETKQWIMPLPFCIMDTEITIAMQRMMVYDKENRISASDVVSILNC
jgi:serine/threonine protein kinase